MWFSMKAGRQPWELTDTAFRKMSYPNYRCLLCLIKMAWCLSMAEGLSWFEFCISSKIITFRSSFLPCWFTGHIYCSGTFASYSCCHQLSLHIVRVIERPLWNVCCWKPAPSVGLSTHGDGEVTVPVFILSSQSPTVKWSCFLSHNGTKTSWPAFEDTAFTPWRAWLFFPGHPATLGLWAHFGVRDDLVISWFPQDVLSRCCAVSQMWSICGSVYVTTLTWQLCVQK